MSAPDLLPPSATELERTVSLSTDSYTRVGVHITAMRGRKYSNPPPSWLPFIVSELGLGELSPYAPNLYDLIDEGVDWQRVRGTPDAVLRALGWLSYAAEIESFPPRRRYWNLVMLHLDRVRDDEADLIRIDGVSTLSVPKRSVIWRGYHGYDVRAIEAGRTRWGQTLWSAFSGARIPQSDVKWSFGRRYEADHALTDAELQALGVWLDPVDESDGGWQWGPFPWPALPWSSSAATVRSAAMLAAMPAGPVFAVFRDAAGDVIGYRRARARWPVQPALDGIYSVGGNRWAVRPTGATRLYVEAMTDFGDGYGATAASVGLVFGATPAAGLKPGALWLPADGLAPTGPIVAEFPANIEFGRTVRERVCWLLRF
ncbi:hypothetical protein GGR16_003270 [Chelatococcus caeni]|uniref:Phage tail protein n=1 Tax=Chelatococcus caeni TaxID=1348468 RepID=A0A840C5P5_9HYPH|nr:phage tail protein [Chelatococcus caeni]MBB4018236.1 hypothetical protein [Chelatococcus caeni]